RDETVFDVLQDRQSVTLGRIAPATTTGGDDAQDIAVVQFEIVPEGRNMPFLRCVRVDHEITTLTRLAAVAAPGGAFDTVHARAKDGLGGQHAHVAHYASTTTEYARATAVLMNGVGEDLHGEFALDKLDGEILLAARRVDDVQAITEGARALTNANAVDEQGKRAALGIERTQHVDDVITGSGWRRPIGGLGKIAHNAIEHPVQGVGPQAQRGRLAWLYQAAGTQQHLGNGLEGPVVQQYRGILPGQETRHHHASRFRVQQKIDRPTSLIIGIAKVDADRITMHGERNLHPEGGSAHASAIPVVGKGVTALGHRRERSANGAF